MGIENRKLLWWFVFASCAGSVFVFTGIVVANSKQGQFSIETQIGLFGLCAEGIFAALALWRLKRCYVQEPLNWTGRWQLSLGDLLCVTFFFASIMGICREIEPRQFLNKGLPISMALGIGFTIALLTVARMGRWTSSVQRWCNAFGYLFGAILFFALTTAAQFVTLGFLLIVFMLLLWRN